MKIIFNKYNEFFMKSLKECIEASYATPLNTGSNYGGIDGEPFDGEPFIPVMSDNEIKRNKRNAKHNRVYNRINQPK